MLHDVQWSGDAGANAPTLTALLDAVLAAGPACGPDTAHLFTSTDGETSERRQEREQRAIAICRDCPALGACVMYALALDPGEGVWAGLNLDDQHLIDDSAVA
ncbi:hypothetical protein HD597_010379 [Nonomuraea thailandensis]|uniref:4Fe-4S Wbl-type domain-containing protein n=1 Tax=Nonomuraea thailandensis TaxID=1188745 RepID=A0A9X2GPU9_9ACTN|nr:WhiB family transcriptional regulator [Nonomuraea thailandensis]MCP2363359.1 hypothetical protein [Nonomuraea thailandensis]